MNIDLSHAIDHAKAGRLRLERCGELLQRKFARDFASGVASCFAEFRPRDNRLNEAMESARNWLRGRLNEFELQAAHRKVLHTQDDAFRTRGAMALVMRVVEVFATESQTLRRFYLRISAAKAIRAIVETLAPRHSFDAVRVAEEASQATCVYAFYKRPQLAVRHVRRSHEFVPAAFRTIRENDTRRQCRHVLQNLQWMNQPLVVGLLRDHEQGDPAARAVFWDWCEEQGFDLCPALTDVFDPASLKQLEDLD